MTAEHTPIESPFQFRYSCWFCGEPSATRLLFPHENYVVLACCHPAISLASCLECHHAAKQSTGKNIWQVRSFVKKWLFKSYQKHLAIGLNWTEQELAESQFEGGNFESFQKSAWFMYQVARDRVNFTGWPIIVNGLDLDYLQTEFDSVFVFDGVSYPSIDEAISHYAGVYDLHKGFFRDVLSKLGTTNFAAAVRFCRLFVGASPDERKAALLTL